MWYPATTTTAPTVEPVALDEVKAQSRIETTDEDIYLGGLIRAARGHIERACGIRIMTQTVAIKCDGFSDFAALPVSPIASVSSVTYSDTNGAAQTLAGTVYEARIDGGIAAIVLKSGQSWPDIQTGSRITVNVIAGAAGAPDEIKQAALMLIAHWYVNREAVGQNNVAPMPMAVDALLTNWRRPAFG